MFSSVGLAGHPGNVCKSQLLERGFGLSHSGRGVRVRSEEQVDPSDEWKQPILDLLNALSELVQGLPGSDLILQPEA
jgi:hypothetical protein